MDNSVGNYRSFLMEGVDGENARYVKHKAYLPLVSPGCPNMAERLLVLGLELMKQAKETNLDWKTGAKLHATLEKYLSGSVLTKYVAFVAEYTQKKNE